MQVTIDLDPRDLWVLTDVAEKRGQKIGEYMTARALHSARTEQGIRKASRDRAQRATRENAIRELHAKGYDDGAMSVELNLVRATVASIRRRLELPPNKPNTRKGNI